MEYQQNGFKIISNKNQSLRLFTHPLLERLTHADPLELFYFYSPIILYFCYLGLMSEGFILFVSELLIGIFLWTIVEYCIHRFLFHFQATSQIGKKLFFLIHEIHHAYPRDSTRLVSPPVLSFPLVVIGGFIYHLVFGKHFATLYAGTLFGYIVYETLHYATHHFKLKQPIFYYLKRYHLHHHYIESERGFSVSAPFWDYVFRTQPLETIRKNPQA